MRQATFALLMIATCWATAHAASYTPLGVIPFTPRAVSAEGSVVAGFTGRWTAQGGLESLGSGLPDAFGISADGSVVVGQSQVPFRWTADGGLVEIADS